MTDSLRSRLRHKTLVCLSFLLLASFLPGCARPAAPPDPTSPVFDPHPAFSAGWPLEPTRYPEKAISPDGKYLLAVLDHPEAIDLALVSVQDPAAKPVVYHSVTREWLDKATFTYSPLGWVSDARFLFTIGGWQNQGAHKDERGLAILAGDVATKTVEELGFLPIPLESPPINAEFSMYIPGRNSVAVSLTNSIWEFDLSARKMRLVKDGLSGPDGAFAALISPSGASFVYVSSRGDESGVYLLDLSTGVEKCVLPNGHTVNFWPQWSPDGKYIAVLTAEDRGASGYDLVYGEASPLGAATSITVLDAAGKRVGTATLDGKMAAYPFWSADSSTLGFFGAVRTAEVFPNLRLDSVWTVTPSSPLVPVKLADLPADAGHTWCTEAALAPDGSGAYFRTGTYDQNLVWFASKGKPLARVLPGEQLAFTFRGAPLGVFRNSLLALADGDGKTMIGFLDNGEFRPFGEVTGSGDVSVGGIDSQTIVIRHPNGAGVFEMYSPSK